MTQELERIQIPRNRTSRVAVFHGAGQGVQLATCPIPELAAGETLVRVLVCTICGSDLHTYQGRRSIAGPTVLGHEIIGHVLETAEGHRAGLVPGDRVTWSLCDGCGHCFFCREGLPQKCVQLRKYGHEADAQWPLSGGLADVCILRPGTAVLRVPDGLPDLVACPANCATATVAAALRVAGDCAGRAVLILGAGMLGLTAAAMARDRGAAAVIVADVEAARASRASQFGASQTFCLGGDGPAELLRMAQHATDGRGADVVLEMSGAPSSVEHAASYCRIGGCLVLVGSVFPARPVAWNPEQIVRRLLRIEGVHNYRPEDLAEALRFLVRAQDRYPLADLVAKTFSLEDVEQAFRYAVDSRAIRIAVVP